MLSVSKRFAAAAFIVSVASSAVAQTAALGGIGGIIRDNTGAVVAGR